MREKIPCDHCATEAVGELYGESLCPGCLMSIVVCEDETVQIHALGSNSPSNTAREDAKSC
jgi:hypothetical protein